MLRFFWDTAILINPQSRDLDEGVRFPICNKDNLKIEFQTAGLAEIDVTTLDINMQFKNSEDYWNPFLGGQGPAPAYFDSLSIESQEELRKRIYDQLLIETDGSIQLLGRAIAIKRINKQ